MDRRLIKQTVNFDGRVEVAMRNLLSGAVAIPLVELGELHGFTETVRFQATMKNLQSFETKLSKTGAIGYRFTPDFINKRIVFDLYQGKDRTFSQTTNNRVIFSEDYNNLNNALYKYNDQGLRTYAVVGGEGEGSSRVYVTIGSGSGLGLRELFVDAKDIQSEGLTSAEYREALLQRGREALNEAIISESLECETEAAINFTYKEDYDLGDIVTIRKKKWGLYMNQRITELQEVYQYGSLTVVPTFGDPLPETVNFNED